MPNWREFISREYENGMTRICYIYYFYEATEKDFNIFFSYFSKFYPNVIPLQENFRDVRLSNGNLIKIAKYKDQLCVTNRDFSEPILVSVADLIPEGEKIVDKIQEI